MKRRNLTNQNIYEIGQKVLKSYRATDEDINAVIAAKDLFEPVRTAMRAGGRPNAGNSSFTRNPSRILVLRLAFAAVAAILIAAFGVVYFIRNTGPLPEVVQGPNQPAIAIEPWSNMGSIEEPGRPKRATIFARQDRYRGSKPVIHRTPLPSSVEREEVGEFQAVTYTGSAAAAGSSGQIVRVRLPRSSLFAMGIELPVENQTTDKIKADLLIGEDGVMKAVRIVN
jgi:hypothetical protein